MIARVYLLVTTDEFELPVFVFDRQRQIADFFGMSRNDIAGRIKRGVLFKGYRGEKLRGIAVDVTCD